MYKYHFDQYSKLLQHQNLVQDRLQIQIMVCVYEWLKDIVLLNGLKQIQIHFLFLEIQVLSILLL